MSLSIVEMAGWFATVLSVVSLVPQVWRTWIRRSAEDISAGWLVMAFLGTGGWVVYGVLLPAFEVLVTNALVCSLICALFVMKLTFRRSG